MIEGPHFRGIEKPPGLAVIFEGIVVPAVPQSFDDLDEFMGAAITFVMLVVLIEAEILGLDIAEA